MTQYIRTIRLWFYEEIKYHLLRFPIFKMMSSCSPVCIYLASLGEVTWMPSLRMKIMPGPNPWHKMEQCAN